MTMLSFRADDALAAELDVEAALAGVARSELLTRAVRELLYRMRCERDAETYTRVPIAANELFGADAEAWPDDEGTDWSALFGR